MADEPQGMAELRATRNAMQRRGAVITDDLNTHFRNARLAQEQQQLSQRIGSAVGPYGMIRRAQSGIAVDRVFDVPYNPFRNRTAVETPKNDKERRARYRYYAQYDPYVGAAIDLHSEFPLSTFEMQHEDPSLQEEFNDIAEDINLFDFLIDMAREYWICGESFPMGFFDDAHDPTVWTKFILLNPDLVKIIHHEMMQGNHTYEVFLQLDSIITNIVNRGPFDPETKNAFRRLPEDVIQYAKKGVPMPLSPIQVSHFKRKGSNTFGLRGESMMSQVLHILAYRDKLRDAQYSCADRQVTPREMYLIGNDQEPADQSELDAFSNLLGQSWLDPNLAIVWHHAVRVERISGDTTINNLRGEIEMIDNELMAAMMLNKTFLDGSGPTYANASVAMDVLISRYIQFRQRIERWMRDSVWAPLCRIHNIYKPTKAEIDHRIRVKGTAKKPWTPRVAWSKYEMRDNMAKTQLYERLVTTGLLPSDYLYQSLNLNPRIIRSEMKTEMERKRKELEDNPELMESMPGMPGKPGKGLPMPGGMPMPSGGGGAPMGPGGVPKGMPAPGVLPIQMGEVPPDIAIPRPRQIPEESRRPIGLPTG